MSIELKDITQLHLGICILAYKLYKNSVNKSGENKYKRPRNMNDELMQKLFVLYNHTSAYEYPLRGLPGGYINSSFEDNLMGLLKELEVESIYPEILEALNSHEAQNVILRIMEKIERWGFTGHRSDGDEEVRPQPKHQEGGSSWNHGFLFNEFIYA